MLKNTYGYKSWQDGQAFYEKWEGSGQGYSNQVSKYYAEIEYDRDIYEHFKLSGDILDVGGGLGTVREFLGESTRLVSIDPFIDAPMSIPPAKLEASKCLSKPLNFIAALAEFIPFTSESFDYVHMRSMLDHVQVPDLALIEAHRVLKPYGKLLVGLAVDGGESGRKSIKMMLKDALKETLGVIGVHKFRDHHTWHPTFPNLLRLIGDNGFIIEESYWQPYWQNQVVYVLARKRAGI